MVKLHQAFGDMVSQLQSFSKWSAAETFDENRLTYATPTSTLMTSLSAEQIRESQRARLCETLRAKSEEVLAAKTAEKATLKQELLELTAGTGKTVEKLAAEEVRQLQESEREDGNHARFLEGEVRQLQESKREEVRQLQKAEREDGLALFEEEQAVEALERAVEALERVLTKKRKELEEDEAHADAEDAEDQAREEKRQRLLLKTDADAEDQAREKKRQRLLESSPLSSRTRPGHADEEDQAREEKRQRLLESSLLEPGDVPAQLAAADYEGTS
ncbi:hypothetical protein T484DRAFT_1844600 [Baffinella frigidus]|nr:hypothetical protein T484DRAFT_1844600 [Cryptophyta sp. CCMP2293]